MNNRSEQLRLAVGLAHVVPGAELTITMTDGRRIVASTSRSADLDICALRQALVANACHSRPDLANWVTSVSLGGSITHLEGDLFRQDNPDQRWFATTSSAERAWEILESIPLEVTTQGLVNACLRPDPSLGVTLVSISVEQSNIANQLDELAKSAYRASVVDEILKTNRQEALH